MAIPCAFNGSCHCQALGFTYTTALPAAGWNVRACQCSFCLAHGAAGTTDAEGQLTFHVREPQAVRRYRFGTSTADFVLCAHCGVHLGVQTASSRGPLGVINVRALTPLPADIAAAAVVDFDGESTAQRIARREARWTPLTALI